MSLNGLPTCGQSLESVVYLTLEPRTVCQICRYQAILTCLDEAILFSADMSDTPASGARCGCVATRRTTADSLAHPLRGSICQITFAHNAGSSESA